MRKEKSSMVTTFTASNNQCKLLSFTRLDFSHAAKLEKGSDVFWFLPLCSIACWRCYASLPNWWQVEFIRL